MIHIAECNRHTLHRCTHGEPSTSGFVVNWPRESQSQLCWFHTCALSTASPVSRLGRGSECSHGLGCMYLFFLTLLPWEAHLECSCEATSRALSWGDEAGFLCGGLGGSSGRSPAEAMSQGDLWECPPPVVHAGVAALVQAARAAGAAGGVPLCAALMGPRPRPACLKASQMASPQNYLLAASIPADP